MVNKKVTSKPVATKASKTLKSESTGKASKKAAGSALSQTKSPRKQTSEAAASAASKVLRDKRTSASAKSAAGSALSQAGKKSLTSATKASAKRGGNSTGPKREKKST